MPAIVQSLVSLEGNLCFEDCGESRKVAELDFGHFKQEYYPRLKETLKHSTEISAEFRRQSLEAIPDYVFYRTSQTIVDWSKNGHLLNVFENAQKPKLMVFGSKSSFRSHAGLGGAALCEMPDAGHFMLLDKSEITAKAVLKFLRPILDRAQL